MKIMLAKMTRKIGDKIGKLAKFQLKGTDKLE
jgi:hypothetical protein